jgi:hypothetical protein
MYNSIMHTSRHLAIALAGLALAASPTFAQRPAKPAPPAVKADTTEDDSADDTESSGRPFLFGVAGGALNYDAGRSEQALGAVMRWVPARWFSLSATPTSVRASESATATLPSTSRSGLTDIPLEATLSRGFAGVAWNPSVAGSLGVTLPVGDTASGLGAGEVGYSVSGGLGFAPAEGVWVHAGAGRSLTRFSVQSAFSSGSGWGDISAGTSLTKHVEVSAGISSDLGAVDSTLGRSRSVEGGMSFGIGRAGTLNLSASHGMSGIAPKWSFALGMGTAFPYLSHLGGGSTNATLQQTFGGGTHGLGNGKGSGTGTGTTTTTTGGRGRGRKP